MSISKTPDQALGCSRHDMLRIAHCNFFSKNVGVMRYDEKITSSEQEWSRWRLCTKSLRTPPLCANSVFSVSLWLMNSEQNHTTETQRTPRLHREISGQRLFGQSSYEHDFMSRLLNSIWIILLQFICLRLKIVGFFCQPLSLLIGFIRVTYKTGSVLAINQSLRSTF